MTNQEAINILKNIMEKSRDEKIEQAKNLAITALEWQENQKKE